MGLLKRTPRFHEDTGAQITTIYDFRPLINKLTEERVGEGGDRINTGGVTELSRGGMTELSPKEYTDINKTNINKNPKVKLKKEEKDRVQKYFRNGVFRNGLFDVFDNLYEEIPMDDLVFEGSFKACKDIIINKSKELSEKRINPTTIARKVKKNFPYKNTPEEINNIRKFFVAKICDITSEELLNYL